MKIVLLAFLLTVILTQSPSLVIEDPPKLPIYVGRSYDLLNGNPLSDSVDPGFEHSIFEFTYDKKETTEDGRYLIPDGVSHRKVSSCSFSTDVKEYRGTQSYQSELKTKAAISGGYKGAVLDAAFSFSVAYEDMKKETIQNKMSITHASAECEAYELSIDIFTVNTILPNFLTGVNESYHSKNWDQFITQFGTHFVYEAVMGGRASQEITYEFESVSKMESINVDISIAAKASYAKFFADASFDWQKHTEEVSYAEKLSRTMKELYIGAQPSRDGNIKDWAEKVIDNPMPIRYKIIELSELFSKIKDPSINITEAVLQYHQALDAYCGERNCLKPTPDHPKPPPATLSYYRSPLLGGGGGDPFEFYEPSTTFNAVRFIVRSGSLIDNLQLLLGDGVRKTYSSAQGGGGGNYVQWNVPDGQYVTQVEYRNGSNIDSLTFITNTGTKSPYFGGGGGGYRLITFPQGHRIVGFYGHSGSRMDQLGFILAQTHYPENDMFNIQKSLPSIVSE